MIFTERILLRDSNQSMFEKAVSKHLTELEDDIYKLTEIRLSTNFKKSDEFDNGVANSL